MKKIISRKTVFIILFISAIYKNWNGFDFLKTADKEPIFNRKNTLRY